DWNGSEGEATPPVSVARVSSSDDKPIPVAPPIRVAEPGAFRDDVVPEGVEGHLVSLLFPASFEAEQYRELQHRVEHLHRAAQLVTIAVSSPAVGDGKTTTAINLAGALAQSPGARVLLMDVDLRRPSIAAFLGLEVSGPGLVEAVLDERLGLDDALQHCPAFNLSVVPAGEPPLAPYEVLKSPRFEALLAEARQRYDYVVLDSTPLVDVTDCRLLGRCVDGFLVVVMAHKTPRRLVEEALTVMDSSKIIGIVFNRDDRRLKGPLS